jgi:hypothetical protein
MRKRLVRLLLAKKQAEAYPVPLKGETYIDESGLTVTRYPARTAAGAFRQDDTVRPSPKPNRKRD